MSGQIDGEKRSKNGESKERYEPDELRRFGSKRLSSCKFRGF